MPRRLHLRHAAVGDRRGRRHGGRRLAQHGPNDALSHRRRPLWRQVLERFANPLVLILLFAAGVSAWTGEVASFVIITAIILLTIAPTLGKQFGYMAEASTLFALLTYLGACAAALKYRVRGERALAYGEQLLGDQRTTLRVGG